MSNLLAMPLVKLQVETGNNEDWVDSIKFVVDTGDIDPPQLDISGIIFEMEVRRAPTEHEVVFAASTESGTLKLGTPPDYGFLIFNVPLAEMAEQSAGDYVGDVIGRDEMHTRVVVQVGLTVVDGVTKQPVNKRVVVVSV